MILLRNEADGSWSLHRDGVSDEELHEGGALLLASASECDPITDEWLRPNAADYEAAEAIRASAAMMSKEAQAAKARFLAQVKKNARENTLRKFAPVFLLLKIVLATLAIWGATVFAKAHGLS